MSGNFRISIGIVTFVVAAILHSASYAQNNTSTPAKAYKFAEFGTISSKDMATKMLEFRNEWNNEDTRRGYIINYGSAKAIKRQRTLMMNAITWRDYDPARITFVDGPYEKKIRTVMWVVPVGADSPSP